MLAPLVRLLTSWDIRRRDPREALNLHELSRQLQLLSRDKSRMRTKTAQEQCSRHPGRYTFQNASRVKFSTSAVISACFQANRIVVFHCGNPPGIVDCNYGRLVQRTSYVNLPVSVQSPRWFAFSNSNLLK